MLLLLLLFFVEPLYALGATGDAQGSNPVAQLLPFVLMFVVLYMLILRPQIKKQKSQRKMIEELKKGDKIVTNGGLHGVISNLKDDIIVLNIAERVKVEVSRSAVSRVKNGDGKS